MTLRIPLRHLGIIILAVLAVAKIVQIQIEIGNPIFYPKMGKSKRKKDDKNRDEPVGKSHRTSRKDTDVKQPQKRSRSTGPKNSADLVPTLPASPRTKIRKQVEVTINQGDSTQTDGVEKGRIVVVKNHDKNNNASVENSGILDGSNQAPVATGVKTRSQGDLTEEDKNAQLPSGRRLSRNQK